MKKSALAITLALSATSFIAIAQDVSHGANNFYIREPKELCWLKNAGHVDLYDRTDVNPLAKWNPFFSRDLK